MNKVLFFAQLRERLGCDTLVVDATGLSVQALKQQLAQKSPQWHDWLLNKDVLVAVNQELVDEQTHIGLQDEIAMFPPVTGG